VRKVVAQAQPRDVSGLQDERDKMRRQGLIPAVVVAKLLKKHYVTIHRWITDGKVEHVKVGGWRVYITVASLVTYLGPEAAKAYGLI
jgi:hypothetical protein